MEGDKTFKARVREHNGLPTIFVNGRPGHFGSVGINCQAQRKISFFEADISSLCMLWMPELSTVSDEPEFDVIKKRIDDMLADKPEALLSCVVELRPSVKWCKDNPDEMTVYDIPLQWSEIRNGRNPEPSWASEKWRKDSSDFLFKICSFIHETYGGRVILYNIGGGKCGENYPALDPVKPGYWYCGDFSEAMLQWFRAKLREFYDDDVTRLQRFWSDNEVTFENAQIPGRIERLKIDWFSLRSPLKSQVADFYRARSLAVEECVISWAKAVKDATNKESLTASSMGTVLDCGLNSYAVHHLPKNTFRKCLNSEYLDMFQSPSSYCFRTLGSGASSAMIPLGTLKLAKKMWFRDFDSRTSLIGNDLTKDPSGSLWQDPRDEWEDVQLLRRDACHSIINGGAWFWQEHRDGMYKLPAHIKTAEEIQRIGAEVLELDRSPVGGMAVIVDNESNFYLSNSSRLVFKMNYEARLCHWTHSSVASDIYTAGDLDAMRGLGHKFFMVTNAFKLSRQQAEKIKDMARSVGGTILWLMAPGVMTDAGFDLANVSDITGFKIKALGIEALCRVTFVQENMRQVFGADMGGSFGLGFKRIDDSGASNVGPIFYADVEGDTDAEVLGLLDAVNEPGFVIRQADGYKSVYCSAMYVPHYLINLLAADSGAHVYSQRQDYMQVASELLLVNAAADGDIEINWHKKAGVVTDMFSGQVIARDTDRWVLKSRTLQTHFVSAR